ncbi:MAG: aldo/keto reductase [Cyanobacteria bacterium P01_A01_bin.83]
MKLFQPLIKVPATERKKFSQSDISFYRELGRTNLTTSCLGLGGGGGISSRDTIYAVEQGINYLFYSSDLHHFIYSSMAKAIRKLCGRSSSAREQIVLATVTYIKSPEMALAALYDQFCELGIDYIDILFWGWIGANDSSALRNCLSISPDLRGPNTVYQRQIEKTFGISERLKKMGAVRYIGASFHSHDLAQQWLNSPLLDVVMVRHNVAHRHAQKKVFAPLKPEDPDRSGIVTFKSSGMGTSLWQPPKSLPQECWKPSVPDLYRYSLSQNCVDVCLTGLTNRQEIDAAIAGIEQGKLTEAELRYLEIYGDLHRKKQHIQNINPEDLIYI